MATLVNSSAEFWSSNENDILQNGKDGTSSAKSSRNVVYDTEAGQRLTTVNVDGDLRELSGTGYLTNNPDDNSSGNATKAYSSAFLLRWLVKIFQSVANGGLVRPSVELQSSSNIVTSNQNQTIASSPNASTSVNIIHLEVTNQSDTPQGYTLKVGNSGAVLYRGFADQSGSVFSIDLSSADYIWKLPAGENLVLQADSSEKYSYNLLYSLS